MFFHIFSTKKLESPRNRLSCPFLSFPKGPVRWVPMGKLPKKTKKEPRSPPLFALLSGEKIEGVERPLDEASHIASLLKSHNVFWNGSEMRRCRVPGKPGHGARQDLRPPWIVTSLRGSFSSLWGALLGRIGNELLGVPLGGPLVI